LQLRLNDPILGWVTLKTSNPQDWSPDDATMTPLFDGPVQ
jgi:hypothetical protein